MSAAVKTVLNASSSQSMASSVGQSVESVGVLLQRTMLSLKGLYILNDGRGVDYDRVRGSPEFAEYCKVADTLSAVNVLGCGEDEKRAFFINVYNALTIHGLVACDKLPSSVLELKGFWNNTCYNIGGHVFSLDEIEHGVLRCNRPHPGQSDAMFSQDDERLQFVVASLDPRIHFALVCGAKSCPAIQVYSAAKLEKGLQAAARSFCGQEVKVDVGSNKVVLSKIFMWYFKDFAETIPGLLQWILQYLEDPVKADLQQMLVDGGSSITVEYSDYNWLLNKL